MQPTAMRRQAKGKVRQLDFNGQRWWVVILDLPPDEKGYRGLVVLDGDGQVGDKDAGIVYGKTKEQVVENALRWLETLKRYGLLDEFVDRLRHLPEEPFPIPDLLPWEKYGRIMAFLMQGKLDEALRQPDITDDDIHAALQMAVAVDVHSAKILELLHVVRDADWEWVDKDEGCIVQGL